jgi:hypothetical protein
MRCVFAPVLSQNWNVPLDFRPFRRSVPAIVRAPQVIMTIGSVRVGLRMQVGEKRVVELAGCSARLGSRSPRC